MLKEAKESMLSIGFDDDKPIEMLIELGIIDWVNRIFGTKKQNTFLANLIMLILKITLVFHG